MSTKHHTVPIMPTQSNSKKNSNEEEYAEDNRVVEPKEVDVLCGRGGMSNHHPGNEWYRRLIRSNRPLYRACPKHTKLLVSKAIVQAVEQQGGRFLERCARKSGFWYPVPYKRAVDKTSQGLRERDREDGHDGNGDDDGDDDGTNTFVPDSFKGNSNVTPNLGDLADVAIAHANASRGAQGLQPPAQQMKRPSLGGGGNNKNKPAMKKQGAVPSKRNSKTSINKNAPAAGTTNPNNNRSSWSQMSPPPGAAAMGGVGPARAAPLPRQPDNTNLSSAAAAADEDLVPLPPTLEQRQSSIFRLFQTAKLLPNSSTALNSELWSQSSPSLAAVTNNDSSDGSVPSNSSNNFNNSGGRGKTQQSPQQQSYSPGRFGPNGAINGNYSYSHPGAPNNIMGAPPGQYATNPAAAAALYEYASQQYPRGGAPPPPYLAAGLSALAAGVNGGQPPFSNSPSLSPPNSNSAGNINNSGNNGADSAPALTRLTSQVSDWLYSFWPVSRMDSVAGPMSGVGGSPTRNGMGQEKGPQQQQQKRPDPLGADADSDEDAGPSLPNRHGAVQTDPSPSNKRKSIGPYSDMVHNQTQSQTKRGSLTAKQEKDIDRDARKRFALAPPIVTIPPPKPPGPVHITTIPPLQKGTDRDLSSSSSSHHSQQQQLQMNDKRRQQQPLHELQQQQQQQYQLQQYQQQQQEHQRRYSQEPPRKRNKRKSSANMPELPYDHRQLLLSGAPGFNMPVGALSSMNANQGGINRGQGLNATNGDSNMDVVAPPTELEQSVSATLLKLAGSPSKHLLSGLTRFFETGETSIGAPLRAPAPGTTEAYFLRAMADATGPQATTMAAAPSQMMSSIGGGSYYGAPPTNSANDFRGGPARGPSLYGNKRSEGDLLEDE